MAQVATLQVSHQPSRWLISVIVFSIAVLAIAAGMVALVGRSGDAEAIGGVITYADEDGVRTGVLPNGDAVQEPAGAQREMARGSAFGVWSAPGDPTVAFIEGESPELWLSLWQANGVAQVTQLTNGSSPPVFVSGKADARAAGAVPLVASWSPDGGALAYGSAMGDTRVLHIMERGARPDRSFALTDGYAGELVWSPDGRLLALSTYSEDGRDHTVYVIDRETGAFTPIIDGCLIVWSPDSRHLAVHRDPHRAYGIWVARADGRSEARQVVADDESYPISWSVQ